MFCTPVNDTEIYQIINRMLHIVADDTEPSRCLLVYHRILNITTVKELD